MLEQGDKDMIRAKGAALAMVLEELARAQKIHEPMATAHHGIAVIREEYKELENEVFKKESIRDNDRMIEEATQVAAMGMRFLIDVCGVGK